MALVCCPGPIRCRSGNDRVASTPKIAIFDGPAIRIASEGCTGFDARWRRGRRADRWR